MFWNARLLPFFYSDPLPARRDRRRRDRALAGLDIRASACHARGPSGSSLRSTPVIGAAICIVILGMSLRILPGGRIVQKQTSSGSVAVYSWLGLDEHAQPRFVDDWAKWNYSGYEGKAAYGEYRGVVQTMKNIGEDARMRPGRVGEQRREPTSTARRWR